MKGLSHLEITPNEIKKNKMIMEINSTIKLCEKLKSQEEERKKARLEEKNNEKKETIKELVDNEIKVDKKEEFCESTQEKQEKLDLTLENMKTSKGALIVIKTLMEAGYNADLVGGCVRDAMLGLEPKDEDITTNLKPDKVVELFERQGYRVIPTGIQHGTVTIMVPNEEGDLEGYEVTTYRIDGESLDHRHPEEVSFTESIKKDMERRDFTINAMAFNPITKQITDFFDGKKDLKEGKIRAVGNPSKRIKEDALRMLRAVRFSAQKNMTIEENLEKAIKEHAEDIQEISKERINAELTKILLSDNPGDGITNLRNLGLLKYISPELDEIYDTPQNNKYHIYDVGKHTEVVINNTPKDKITRLAALFHDIGKPKAKTTDEKGFDHFYGHAEYSASITEKVMRELKFTKKEINDTVQLVRLHDDILKPDREKICCFIEKHPEITPEKFHKLIDLKKGDRAGHNPEFVKGEAEELEQIQKIYEDIVKGPYRISDLAINGKEIQKIQETRRGDTVILFGADIKVAQERLLSYVLRNPEKNNESDLQEYLQTHLKEIKNISILKMFGSKKEEEQEMYNLRKNYEKAKKELTNLDINALYKEKEEYIKTEKIGVNLKNAIKLTEKRNMLLRKLEEKHTEKRPRLSNKELEERKTKEKEQLL